MASGELHPHGGDWLQDVVFGLNDGVVTTLVFILAVSSVASSNVVLVGLGEVIAGGVSMTLGGFLASRTERSLRAKRIATEKHEIREEPEEERAELEEIYRAKGLEGELLHDVIVRLTANEDRWLAAMARDEHGLVAEDQQSPWRRGAGVGGSFVLGGGVPIVPFALHLSEAKWVAIGLTVLVAVILGALKSRYTTGGAIRGAIEFVAVVGAGTIGGVGIGSLLHNL